MNKRGATIVALDCPLTRFNEKPEFRGGVWRFLAICAQHRDLCTSRQVQDRSTVCEKPRFDDRQKRLTFFTQGYGQVAVIFPYLMVSPAYFSGAMQLGGLMQTASAFNSVQGALSYFINIYTELRNTVR